MSDDYITYENADNFLPSREECKDMERAISDLIIDHMYKMKKNSAYKNKNNNSKIDEMLREGRVSAIISMCGRILITYAARSARRRGIADVDKFIEYADNLIEISIMSLAEDAFNICTEDEINKMLKGEKRKDNTKAI